MATVSQKTSINPPNCTTDPSISVIVPIFNEVANLRLLIDAIETALNPTQLSYEIICVDDGSEDGSTELLTELAKNHSVLTAVILRRNYGQTPAMAAGFHQASGDILVTLDGDLQNDPQDIPHLVNTLNRGYDLVSGWRKQRKDDALTRIFPSKIANWVISQITEVKLHDYGCSLKAYRAELIADMNLYGDLHRFIPALAYLEGAKITEVEVRHHPRRFGKSKYGLARTFSVMMDLITISFMNKFLTRPMHIFGLLGLFSLVLGMGIGGYLTVLKLVLAENIGNRPLLVLAILLVLTGVQLFCFGLLAELLMRTYHESQKRPIYRIRDIVGRCQL